MRCKRVLRVGTSLVVSASLLAACTSLPTNSDPHVLRSFQPLQPTETVIGPEENREPDLLLRDFYAASAIPTGSYEAARAFLTPAARQMWDPSEQTLIVDRIGVNTQAGPSANKRSFTVHGNVVGTLGSGGVFSPERGSYEATIELEQVDGQWRISSLPAGIVMERTELRNQYQPYNLYYFDSAGQELVTDRRWVYAPRDYLASTLISLLLDGPARRLQPALDVELPASVSYTGYEEDAFNFTGFADTDEEERTRFAAQVVWTLASAGINGPFVLRADGEPLLANAQELTTDDFVEVSPFMDAVGDTALYTLADGKVARVTGGAPQQVSGMLGNAGNVLTADISADGRWAGVFGSNEEGAEVVLRAGQEGANGRELLRAETFSQPSLESNAGAVWAVADGQRIVRAVQSAATGEVVTAEIQAELPAGVEGNISVLRLSRTGSRVVMVIDGRLYTGIVDRRSPGGRSIVNVLEYAFELGGTVVAADWQPDGSLIVGTSHPSSPVMRVEQDGSSATTLSIGNISSPVVAVASSSNMLYATDANAILQMPVSSADTPIWREVPGLQGMRSLPIVAK